MRGKVRDKKKKSIPKGKGYLFLPLKLGNFYYKCGKLHFYVGLSRILGLVHNRLIANVYHVLRFGMYIM